MHTIDAGSAGRLSHLEDEEAMRQANAIRHVFAPLHKKRSLCREKAAFLQLV